MGLVLGTRYRVHAAGNNDWNVRPVSKKFPVTTKDSVGITDAEFFVDEFKRKRKAEEGQASLHAWVYGDYVGENPGWDVSDWEVIVYDPYTCTFFQTKEGTHVYHAEKVMFQDNAVYAYKPT